MDEGMSRLLTPLGESTKIGSRLSESRAERMHKFGIDCGDGLLWGGGAWEPGGEYVKRLQVKNVSATMQTIRWALPETKYFSMDFPDPVRLAPGNSVFLEVRFRPVKREEYDDVVTFHVDGGRFTVPVRARLSRLATQIPSTIQFGLVPVNEPTAVAFTLDNLGQVPAQFEWDCVEPFVVEPRRGVVEPGASFDLTCTLLPADASIMHARARVRVEGLGDDVAGEGWEQHSMVLSATSKFQHISLSTERVDLGDVMVGSGLVERDIVVTNPGPVRATVSVAPVETDRRPHFHLTPPVVLVPPDGGTATLRLSYRPRVHGSFSCERFQFSTPGGSAAVLEAKACARGPLVTARRKDSAGKVNRAPPSSFSFGDVAVGTKTTHVCRFRNASDSPASFAVLAEAGGVFRFSAVQGVVPARLFFDVTIAFTPRCPGNFYRRIYVLIKDSDPTFLDLFGAGTDERNRPFPIRQRHIDAYRLRPPEVKLMSPDSVLRIAKLHAAVLASGGDPEVELPTRHGIPALTSPFTRAQEAELALVQEAGASLSRRILTQGEERSRGASALLEEMLAPHDAADKPYHLNTTRVEFGSSHVGTAPVTRTVSVANRTDGRVTVQWHVPLSSADRDVSVLDVLDGGVRDFSVSPPVTDIEAGESAEFVVSFAPHQEGSWYAQELEATVFPKQNRTFRLVDDESFTPPETLLLRVMGHTFTDGTGFLPRFSTSLGHGLTSPLELEMPACPAGAITHAVVELRNDGQVPMAFEIVPPDPTGIITVAPRLGMVPVGEFVLLVVRFAPPVFVGTRNFSHSFQLLLNGDAGASPTLMVRGVASSPRISIPDDGAIYIAPTALSSTTTVIVPVASATRVPASFRFDIPRELRKLVRVSPESGVVRGNEALDVHVTFCPRRRGPISLNMGCLVYSGGAHAFTILGVAADALNGYNLFRSFDARDLMSATNAATKASAVAAAVGTGRLVDEDDEFGETKAEEEAAPPVPTGAAALVASPDNVPMPPADPASIWPWGPVEQTDEVHATVMSQGTDGALAFLPPGVDLGPSLVGEGVHRALSLENKSGCTLRWKLVGFVDTEPAAADEVHPQTSSTEAATTLNDWDMDADLDEDEARSAERTAGLRDGPSRVGSRMSRTAPTSARSGFTSTTAEGGRRAPLMEPSDSQTDAPAEAVQVNFEPMEGTLPARSRTQVDVSIVPKRAGRTAVRIAYTLESIDHSGTVTKHGAEAVDAALAAQASARAVRRAATDLAHKTGVMIIPPSPSLNKDAIWCDVRTTASYPALVVEDARVLTGRESLLWLFPTPSVASGPRAEDLFRSLPSVAAMSVDGIGGQDLLDALVAEAAHKHLSVDSKLPSPTNAAGADPAALSSRGSGRGWSRPAAAEAVRPASVLALAMPEPEPTMAGDPVGGWTFKLPAPLALPWQGPLSATAAQAFDGWKPEQPNPPLPLSGSPYRLWEQCSLRALNRILSQKLTPVEEALAEAAPSNRDTSDLRTVTVEFTPAPLGSHPEVILWQVRNVGGLPAVMEVAFPSDAEIDTETWAEPSEPSRAEIRTRQLLDRRIFDVQPRTLRIAPGGCATLRLHYAHVTTALADGPEGTHQVELLLKLRRGRTIRMRLRGKTLRPHIPFLWFGSPLASRRLEPVPLGISRAPLQYVRVSNPTAMSICYQVDITAFEAARKTSHGFSVWECLNPSGIIAAKGETTLAVRFTPLEAIEYVLPLRIRFGPVDADAPVLSALRSVQEEAGATAADAIEAGMFSADEFSSSRRAEQTVFLDTMVERTISALESADAAHASVVDAAARDPALGEKARLLERARKRRRKQLGLPAGAEVTPAMLRALSVGLSVTLRGRGYTPLVDVDADLEADGRVIDSLPPLVRPGLLTYGSVGAAAETASIAAGGASVRVACRTDGLEGDLEDVAAEAGDETGSSAAAEGLVSLPDPGSASQAALSGFDSAASLESNVATIAESQPPVVTSAATPASHLKRIRQVLQSLATEAVPKGTAAAGIAPQQKPQWMAGRNAPLRVPRPGCAPPPFHGAFPPMRRHLQYPAQWMVEGMARCVPEWVRFGDVPTGSRTFRTVVLINDRGVPTNVGNRLASPPSETSLQGLLEATGRAHRPEEKLALAIGKAVGYGGGGGAVTFSWDESHPLLSEGGCLSVHPRRGRLEPGEAMVCRFVLAAGAEPRTIQDDIPVAVAIPEEEMVARALKARKRAATLALAEQQSASRRPPEAAHVAVHLKTTAARNARITAAATEKHLKASLRDRGSTGDITATSKSRSERRQKIAREEQGGGVEDDAASVTSRRAGAGLAPPHVAAVALGAGRMGFQPEDAFRGVGADPSKPSATRPLAGVGPKDPAEARITGVAAAVRDALSTMQAAQPPPTAGNEDDAPQEGRSQAAKSQASSRSRLSSSKSAAAVETAAASVPTPVPPAARLFVHITARICNEQEFVQAHGSSRLDAFVKAQAVPVTETGLPELHGTRVRDEAPEEAVDPDDQGVMLPPDAVAGAGGGSEERGTLETMLQTLLADVVRGPEVRGTLDGLISAQGTTFRELAARRGRSLAGEAPSEGAAPSSNERVAVLRSGEARRLCTKYVETTVLNVVREATAGTLNFATVPRTLVSLTGNE
jgi:hypothetical protein